MSPTQERPSKGDAAPPGPLLPECVEFANELGDALEEAAFQPFPDLDVEPRDAGHVLDLLLEAQAWAKKINQICVGRLPEHISLTDARRLNTLHGGQLHQHVSLATLFAASIQERMRKDGSIHPGSTAWARDVLGTPPECYTTGCNTEAIAEIANRVRDRIPLPVEQPVHFRIGFETRVLDPISDWPIICEKLISAYRTSRAQALLIVGWILARTNSLRDALIPSIKMPHDSQSQQVEVWVRLAGVKRLRDITGRHYDLLLSLKEDGEVTATRNLVMGKASRALVYRIPELRGHIRSVSGTGGKGDTAVYCIPDDLRERIHVAPPPEKKA